VRIPNADRAVVDPAKLRDYLLSTTHTVGRFKAAFFCGQLGYSAFQLAPSGEGPPRTASFSTRTGWRIERVRPKVRDTSDAGWADRRISGCCQCLDREGRQRFSDVRDCVSGKVAMKFRVLDTVVLDRDLTEHRLKKGDLGAVVEVYEPDALDVEFVTASGRTEALVTLSEKDVRSVADDDLVSVRPARRSA
jgi:hypothetical protein